MLFAFARPDSALSDRSDGGLHAGETRLEAAGPSGRDDVRQPGRGSLGLQLAAEGAVDEGGEEGVHLATDRGCLSLQHLKAVGEEALPRIAHRNHLVVPIRPKSALGFQWLVAPSRPRRLAISWEYAIVTGIGAG